MSGAVRIFMATALVGLAALAPATLAAQVPNASPVAPDTGASGHTQAAKTKPVKRPEYQSLRFDERWPAMPAGHGADPFDPLKHIALTPNGSSYVTLGGQFRYRAEGVDHFQLGDGTARRDAYGLTRTDLSADVQFGQHVRAFGEVRDAVASGRTLPGGARPQDTDRWDVQNAFVEATTGKGAARLRVGRQELAIGRERLIGPGDWSNARRTFEGVRVEVRPTASSSVMLLRVRPVALSLAEPNHADTASLLWGGVATRELPQHITAQLLALRLDQPPSSQRRTTLGGRVVGPLPVPSLSWLALEVEGGAQRGTLADRDIQAWYFVSEATATGAHLRFRPTLAVGYDRASGDANAADGKVQTFVAPYPTAHSFTGLGDVVGRSNLVDARLIGTAQSTLLGTLRVELHDFRRLRATDAAYGKSGVLRAAGADSSLALGDELDATLTRAVGRHVKLLAGGARFAPGAFLRHAPATSHTMTWAFTGATLTF